MTHARLDLRYEHEMRAVLRQAATPMQPFFEARGLAARLRGLKALMDAERDNLAAWMVAPHTVFS